MHTKDSKITSLEFRPAARAGDRGFFLCTGTKEGHLFEVDVRTGNVTASKHAAHGHCVSHIFRHGWRLDPSTLHLIATKNCWLAIT
jgi:hypothetical protein